MIRIVLGTPFKHIHNKEPESERKNDGNYLPYASKDFIVRALDPLRTQ